MSLPVTCPKCGGRFQAKDEWAGRRTKCPKCAAEIVISSGNATAGGSGPPTVVPSAAVASAAPPPLPPTVSPIPQPPPASEVPIVNIQAVPQGAGTFGAKRAAVPVAPVRATPLVGGIRGMSQRTKLVALGAGGVAVLVAGIAIGVWVLGGGERTAVATVEAPAVAPQPATAAATASVEPAGGSPDVPQELADVVDRIRPGIVLITVMDQKGDQLGLGSGFVATQSGLIVTNHHVIAGGARATARCSNGIIVEVKSVVKADEARDLAILQLDLVPDGVKPLDFAVDAVLRQGAKVVAMGHPRGLDYSVTEGIISAVRTTAELPENAREFLGAPSDQQWIQTTAAISGGNSGGPLMLPDGRVIGINTWVAPGENLGFAGHIRHVRTLLDEASAAPQTDTLAAYNTAHGGLKRAIVDEIDAFAEGLDKVVKEAEEIDWQPTNEENVRTIEIVVGGVTVARTQGLSSQEIESAGKRLAARRWDFTRHVARLNAYTIDGLSNDGEAAMCYGRVVARNPRDRKQFIMQLAGRGHVLAVTDLFDPKQPHRVGDDVLVLGLKTQFDPRSKMHHVAAGLVVKTSWTTAPDDAVLRECADYVELLRNLDAVQKLASAQYARFPAINSIANGSAVRPPIRVTLNGGGHQFDAVQLPASSSKPDDDLALFFAAPPESIEAWGIMSADGVIPEGFRRSYELFDYAPNNASWAEDDVCRFQLLSGRHLKASRKHLLWFKFRDREPVELVISAAYRPAGLLDGGSDALISQFGLPAAPPSVARNLSQLVFGAASGATTVAGGATTAPAQRRVTAAVGIDATLRPAGGATVGSAKAGDVPSGGLGRIELPGFKPDEIATAVVVDRLDSDAKLELINPDQPAYSAIASYEVAAATGAADSWTIAAVTKKGEHKPIARLFSEAGELKFQWNTGVTRAEGGGLRNCVLRMTAGGTERAVVFRGLAQQPPLMLDFKKDLNRIAIGEDLPADAGMSLVFDSLSGAADGGAVSAEKVPFRIATFVVLKSADDQVPGARLRAVLWRSGSRTELIVRPELTPIAEDGAGSPNRAGTPARNLKSSGSTSAEQVDPTASADQRFITFTINGLARLKSALQTQVATCKTRIANDQNLITTKTLQIRSYDGFVGTADEVAAVQARIARLRSEILALQNEVAQLTNALPPLEKQLAACPPLETLGNSLHLKAGLNLRVVYQAGPYEVPLLQLGGP